MTYIGIDNGVSGAIAVLTSYGALVDWAPMPIIRARKGNEIDVCAFWRWVDNATGGKTGEGDAVFVLEEPGGSKSARAAASMAASFGALRAALAIKQARWHRVTPQAWQRVLLPGCKKGESKARAIEAAGRLWPNESWRATERCTTAHDGGIDAALIAEYGRRAGL